MNRRTFISAIASGLATALFAAKALADRPSRIGFLPLGSPSNIYDRSLVEAFRKGLREAGLVEDRDVILDVVWIDSEAELAHSVTALIDRGAKMLVSVGTSASLAAMRLGSTLPILFISVGNPVGVGLVESLSRPGRNITGFSDILADLSGKYVQFAQELGKPQAAVYYLWYTGWADGKHRHQATERAAKSLGVKLQSRGIADLAEINGAMDAMKKGGATTLIIQPSPFAFRQRGRLIDAAMNHGLATIFAYPPAAREGALVAYGPDYANLYQRAASYAEKILNGTKPADLPVQEPTKLELVVNLKTANALGLTIPPSLLLQADEVVRQ